MTNECPIVRDLLPLYAEDMVSPDTAAFVAAHLAECKSCRQALPQLAVPRPAPPSDAAPLQTLRRKLKRKRVQTIALTALFVAALMVCAFAVLDAPVYLPYAQGLVTPEGPGDKGVTLNFDERVTKFAYTVYNDPDSGVCHCDVEAWTTLWDRWFPPKSGGLSTTVAGTGEPMYVFYVPNDGSENVCLAKYDPAGNPPLQLDGKTRGVTTLPRLALGYYFLLAAGALGLLTLAWLIARKRPGVRVWVERAGLYPVAYLISHVVVAGGSWSTYSLTRDFALILFLSLILYGGLLLGHNILYLRREIRAAEKNS